VRSEAASENDEILKYHEPKLGDIAAFQHKAYRDSLTRKEREQLAAASTAASSPPASSLGH